MSNKDTVLGDRLKKLRSKKGINQEHVAIDLGISRARYSHYENNHVEPDAEMLRKLATYYNVTIDYLLGNSDNPNPEITNDPLSEIQKIAEEFGIKDLSFYNIDEWKNFTKEDIEDIKKHFEYIAFRAKERKKREE